MVLFRALGEISAKDWGGTLCLWERWTSSELFDEKAFHGEQNPFSRIQSAFSSSAASRKLTGRNPSLQEIIAERGFFIQPS